MLSSQPPAACGAASRSRHGSSRRSSVAVNAVFSLSGAVGGLMRPRRGSSGGGAAHLQVPSVAAVDTATTTSAASPAPPSQQLHPRKAVQGVPAKDRDTVELIMALTNLSTDSLDVLAMQLAEHELALVTTSATCDMMFGSVMDSMAEEYGSAGDGMASPLADVAAAAEQMAAEVRGSSMSSDWVPAAASGQRFSAGPAGRSSHALDQLMAQADYTALSGRGSSKEGAANNSVMARVQALQQQVLAAATKVAAANATTSSSSSGASARSGGASSSSGSASTSYSSPAASLLPRLQRGQAAATESFDEDSCGDAAAMPVIPLSAAAAGGSSSGATRQPAAAAVAAAAAAARGARKAAPPPPPSYPVYHDPASSWLVADAPDGRLRIISITAPPALAAAVAGARASSDLTTFESYSLGAKINKALYAEANALYNRFMPLLLDHLEEAGPSGRVLLCGSGLGGALAGLLLLMFVARGMRGSAFAPAYTLNAPAVLCEVPDFKQFCSKEGCSLQDMDGMLEDLLHRGLLSQLGLAQDAIRNIYYNQGAAEAAVRAVQQPSPGPLAAVAASSSKQLSSMVHYLDVGALAASPYVPEVLRAWLRAGAGAPSGAHETLPLHRLHILNPVGKMMLYVAGPGSSA